MNELTWFALDYKCIRLWDFDVIGNFAAIAEHNFFRRIWQHCVKFYITTECTTSTELIDTSFQFQMSWGQDMNLLKWWKITDSVNIINRNLEHVQIVSILCTDCVNIRNPKYFITLKYHNFQRSMAPLKTIILIKKILTECRSPIQRAFFDTFRAKNGRLFTRQLTFESTRELCFF